eukprot:1830154-Amphidinium_carterae.1
MGHEHKAVHEAVLQMARRHWKVRSGEWSQYNHGPREDRDGSQQSEGSHGTTAHAEDQSADNL